MLKRNHYIETWCFVYYSAPRDLTSSLHCRYNRSVFTITLFLHQLQLWYWLFNTNDLAHPYYAACLSLGQYNGLYWFRCNTPVPRSWLAILSQLWGALVGYRVTLTFDLIHDLDLWFFKVKFQNSCISGIVIWLMWNTKKSKSDTGLNVCSRPLATPMTLTL